MSDVFGVQPYHSGFERVGNPKRAAHVFGPDIARQTILNVVGNLDGIGLILERYHRQKRAEHFFLSDAHVGARTCHERRLNIMSAARSIMSSAADGNRCTVFLRDLEIGTDFGEMTFVNQRPDFSAGIKRMTDLERFDACRKFFVEFINDGILYQQPA